MGVPGLALIEYKEDERNNYQYVILEIDEELTHLSPDLIQRVLVIFMAIGEK